MENRTKNEASSKLPKCFVSYSWDNQEHKDWVRHLAEELEKSWVDTLLDQWDVYPGKDFVIYMNTSIRESDFVLLVCTPTYAEKANAGSGGAGYESSIVNAEIFNQVASPGKFIPVLRSGNQTESLPSYLLSKAFVDFRDEKNFASSLETLLRHIYKSPLHVRPARGPKPYLPPSIPIFSSPAPPDVTQPEDTLLVNRPKRVRGKSTKRAGAPRVASYNDNVFISSPLNQAYKCTFEAIVFAVFDCGFRARSVLEARAAGQTRLNGIFDIISECKSGIYDISLLTGSEPDVPSMHNITFELGVFLGAQRFGNNRQKEKLCLILDRDLNRYRKSLSDLAGFDIYAYNDDPHTVIRIVRDWLRAQSGRSNIPGSNAIWKRYQAFNKALPSITAHLKLPTESLEFVDYAYILSAWLREAAI